MGEGSTFRRWLIERLVTTRFMVHRDDTDESIAERLGVRVDVLREARIEYDVQQRKIGASRGRLGTTRVRNEAAARFHLFLEPPEEIYKEWIELVKVRGLDNATLLRSVVHHMLIMKTQPRWIAVPHGMASWAYRGQWLGQKNIRAHKFRIKTHLNEPASRALTLRAQNTGVTASAIARWGVCWLLEDALTSLLIVPSTTSMYKRAEEYCLSPKLVD